MLVSILNDYDWSVKSEANDTCIEASDVNH